MSRSYKGLGALSLKQFRLFARIPDKKALSELVETALPAELPMQQWEHATAVWDGPRLATQNMS